MANDKNDRKYNYTKDTMLLTVLENEDSGAADFRIFDDGKRKPYVIIQCEMVHPLKDGSKVPVKIISFGKEILDMASGGELVCGKQYRVHGDWQSREWKPTNGETKILNTLIVNYRDDFMECNNKAILKEAATKTRCAVSGIVRGQAMSCITRGGNNYTKIPFSVNLGDESVICNICIMDSKQIDPLLKQCEKIGSGVKNIEDIQTFDIIGTLLNRDRETGTANIWADKNTRIIINDKGEEQEVASYAIAYDAKPELVNMYHPKSREKNVPAKTAAPVKQEISEEDLLIESFRETGKKTDAGFSK